MAHLLHFILVSAFTTCLSISANADDAQQMAVYRFFEAVRTAVGDTGLTEIIQIDHAS
jgi:hypothetical protein